MTKHKPPFFIVGNDRSGTTMIRLILDRSPQVAIPTESMVLVDFEKIRRGSVDLANHKKAVEFARRVWNHPRVRLWGLRGVPPSPPVGLSHEDAFRFCIESPFRAYAQQHGKERWADKTPPYVFHVDAIRATWPDARILEIVRDGRDVALSICKVPFGANNVYAAARDWADGIRAGRAAAVAVGADLMTVRYEDLVADPRAVVGNLCSFLEIAFDEEMLQIEKTEPDKVIPHEASWFENLWAGINKKSVGKWTTQMTPEEQSLFVAVAGRELRLHGYEVPREEPPLPSWWRADAMLAHDFALRVMNFIRLRVVEERGKELRQSLTRKLRTLEHRS